MSKKGRIEYNRGRPPKFFIDGKEVTEADYDAAFPSKLHEILERGLPVAESSQSWPLVSDALGVHVADVEEANERNKAAGINVQYNRKGQAVIPSREERRKLLRLEGFHDRDGGYGD